MRGHEVASRYSKVLFDSAKRGNRVQDTLNALDQFLLLLDKSKPLLQFLRSPVFLFEEKNRFLQKHCAKDFDAHFLGFVEFLLRKRRFSSLPAIAEAFRKRVRDSLGIARAEIVTAVPLPVESRRKLVEKLEKGENRTIELVEKIDPAVIGGAKVVIDGMMIDGTIQGKLARLKNALLEGSHAH